MAFCLVPVEVFAGCQGLLRPWGFHSGMLQRRTQILAFCYSDVFKVSQALLFTGGTVVEYGGGSQWRNG